MLIHKMEQRSEAWHEIKLGRFSATRIDSLMSAKSTAKYQNCIAEVACEILTHETEENYVSEDMERGIDLEPEARKLYESIFEIEVQEVGFIEPENDYGEWVGVSPDGLVGEYGMLEIKCPKAKTLFKYISDNKLPNEYKWQVQSQLFFTGRQWCDFMAYYPGLKPFLLRVYPDMEMFAQIDKEVLNAIKEVKKIIEIYNNYDHLNS